MRFALVLSLLLAVAAVLFALQNTDPLDIEVLGYVIRSNESVVLITTLLVGLVLGMLTSAPSRIGAGRRAARAEKRLNEVEAARSEAAAARSQAAAGSAIPYTPASGDAAETQRLADEVARRTSATTGPPPPRP